MAHLHLPGVKPATMRARIRVAKRIMAVMKLERLDRAPVIVGELE